MKKLVSLLLCLVLVFSMAACGGNGGTEQGGEKNPGTDNPSTTNVVEEAAMAYFANFADDRNIISTAKLLEKMAAGEDMFILDVRQADAYATSHLKGAVNAPYGAAVAEALEHIPNDVTVYVNCYSGQTSSQVVALLRAAGKYAVNISSGFNNGISKTEGVDAYLETTVNALPTETYAVDDAIEAAIAKYFTDATTGTFASFHFGVDKVKELVDAESTAYTILDVRQAADYAAGHIAGAMNIPFGKNMQTSFNTIPKDKPVIVYCYSGQTASQVLGTLRLLGYEAYNMPGGMGSEGGSGWLGAGNPVVQ